MTRLKRKPYHMRTGKIPSFERWYITEGIKSIQYRWSFEKSLVVFFISFTVLFYFLLYRFDVGGISHPHVVSDFHVQFALYFLYPLLSAGITTSIMLTGWFTYHIYKRVSKSIANAKTGYKYDRQRMKKDIERMQGND